MINEETGNWCWLGGILEKLDNKWEFWIDKDVTLMEFFKKVQKFVVNFLEFMEKKWFSVPVWASIFFLL